MGYADLIHQRLQTLTEQKQAEVYDFVEFIASRNPTAIVVEETERKSKVLSALGAARAAWPKMGSANPDQIATDVRAEWDGRGWEAVR
jgi:hypothetical protein